MSKSPHFPAESPLDRSRRRRRSGFSLRLTRGGMVMLLSMNIVVLAFFARPLVEARFLFPTPSPSSIPTLTLTLTVSPLPSETQFPDTPTPTASLTPTPVSPYPLPDAHFEIFPKQELIILALETGAYTHLYAYHPQELPLTRITSGPWQDMHPSLSPDGTKVAFTSNRNGYWNLYILDMLSGSQTRLTEGLEYEAAPSWSPDGRWIVYEMYKEDKEGGLELLIRPIEGDQEPIRLTEHPAADHSGAWSPQGRQIAFVSTRSGAPEIWLADLDKAGEDRFINLSQNLQGRASHPAWSPDGHRLAWATVENGFHNIYVWDSQNFENEGRPLYVGSGDWPVWSPDGKYLLTLMLAPNQAYLTAYSPDKPGVVLPPLALPGQPAGITWAKADAPLALPEPFTHIAQISPTPVWMPAISPVADIPNGRWSVVPLEDVVAPHALLHDMVDESFQALRAEAAKKIGWDFLSTLENAYVPITSVLGPGMRNDWLYTGRAFAFNTLPYNAGWIAIVREDFSPNTYWRVYLRVRYQDGSAGIPLYEPPWDFSTRYTGNSDDYEQGGGLSQVIPAGYWLDFTRFAANYGWERIPAVSTWRSSFPSTRFNTFAHPSGLDWKSAMLELYPHEALVTPTVIVPPTRTPTPTSRWYQTSTPTLSPTPRPTLTPLPATPTETLTPSPEATATSPVTFTATLRPTQIASVTPGGDP